MQTLVAAVLLLASSAGADVEVTRFEPPAGPLVKDVRSVYADPAGVVWVGTRGGGVSRFDGSDWAQFPQERVGMPGVASIFPGRDGAMWFAGPGGVSRLQNGGWEHFSGGPDRTVGVAFSGFVDTDGSIWLATNVGAAHFDGGAWSWITTDNGLRHAVVHDVLRDRAGDLWFATRGGGLSRLDSQGVWQHFLPDQNIRVLLEDRRGHLWVGTGADGVYRFDGSEWNQYYRGDAVLPLFEDSRDNLWFSRADGGVLRYREGIWTVHTENLPGGEIHAGTESPDGSYWFASTGGLERLRKLKPKPTGGS